MTVRELWVGGAPYRVGGTGYEPVGTVDRTQAEAEESAGGDEDLTALLRVAALCCDAHLLPPGGGRVRWQAVGDPTEAAILVAAAKIGLTEGMLSTWPRLAELPFDSTRKRMTTIQRIDGHTTACVKGATSEVLPRCTMIRRAGRSFPINESMLGEVESVHSTLTSRGLRVLAVAERAMDTPATNHERWRVEDVERDLTCIGLLAMEDPPRPEVPKAVADCRRAGVRVVMVTGDDGRTAAAVGREIGLSDDHPQIVTGADLATMDDEGLSSVLHSDKVLFARVTPEHKLRLVKAYQHQGEVVAVTGDGVNDAPALRRADIGVAMGVTGRDVAREAADMVLADDNFASIAAAIEEGRGVNDAPALKAAHIGIAMGERGTDVAREAAALVLVDDDFASLVTAVRMGRRIYDNLKKAMGFIIAVHIPIAGIALVPLLLGWPLVLMPVHIVFLELVIDPACSIAFEAEAEEPDVMRRPPRRPVSTCSAAGWSRCRSPRGRACSSPRSRCLRLPQVITSIRRSRGA